jgi:hypothetical protein
MFREYTPYPHLLDEMTAVGYSATEWSSIILKNPTSPNPGINGLRRTVYIINIVSEVLDYGIPLDVAKFLCVIAIRNRKEIWISAKSCIELS